MIRTLAFGLALFVGAAYFSPARADSFGSGSNAFNIDFVAIGNAGNAADTSGNPNPVGAVPYAYRMAKYEISEDMVNKANAAAGLGITHTNFGVTKPATSVVWAEIARFANWLNTSAGQPAAYKLDVNGATQLWSPGEPGYDPANRFRNSLAKYFVPSIDEWHKAAYYNPTTSTYFDYPTSSNSPPDGFDTNSDTNFQAAYNEGGLKLQPNDVTNAGVASPYGTVGQGGNAWEWQETEYDLVNDSASADRTIRGGSWDLGITYLQASSRDPRNPAFGHFTLGFRIASKAEVAGDMNGNGVVDAADYVLWRKNDGSPASYTSWRANFGRHAGTAPEVNSAVPEPATIVLMLLAACAFVSRRRRH